MGWKLLTVNVTKYIVQVLGLSEELLFMDVVPFGRRHLKVFFMGLKVLSCAALIRHQHLIEGSSFSRK